MDIIKVKRQNGQEKAKQLRLQAIDTESMRKD